MAFSIPSLQSGGLFSMKIAQKLQRICQYTIQNKTKKLQKLRESQLTYDKEKKILFLACLAEEKYLYYKMYAKGHLSGHSYRILTHNVDMAIDFTRFQGLIRKCVSVSLNNLINVSLAS